MIHDWVRCNNYIVSYVNDFGDEDESDVEYNSSQMDLASTKSETFGCLCRDGM
jgi:hypothetical protein